MSLFSFQFENSQGKFKNFIPTIIRVDIHHVHFFLLEENENYVDDLCFGKPLQGMCHRCLCYRKEAMECLRNSFDR